MIGGRRMSVLENRINPLITDIQKASEANLNYCALSLVLALPDILSSLEKPNVRGRKRYIEWCEEYFLDLHKYPKEEMTGGDMYALRCAYLHNGEDDLSKQCVDHTLARYRFIYSVSGLMIHRNKITNNNISTLQLNLHEFCREIINSTLIFIEKYKNDANVNKLAEKLITIDNDRFGIRI